MTASRREIAEFLLYMLDKSDEYEEPLKLAGGGVFWREGLRRDLLSTIMCRDDWHVVLPRLQRAYEYALRNNIEMRAIIVESFARAGFKPPPTLSKKNRFDWPRLWELLGFLIPMTPREKYYEPGRSDLDALFARSEKFYGKWERRWVTFCLTAQTVMLFFGCWACFALDLAAAVLKLLGADSIRRLIERIV